MFFERKRFDFFLFPWSLILKLDLPVLHFFVKKKKEK